MMKSRLATYIIVLLLTQSTSYSQRINFNWLVGTWKLNTGRGHIIETWQKINDSVYQGKSRLAKEKDTVIQESLEIIRTAVSKDTVWYYVSTVTNQNNNQPVRFKIIFQRGFEFICENPSHDFPQRISYRRNLPRYLQASIEGYRKSTYNKQNFNFYAEESEELFVYELHPKSKLESGLLHDTAVANTMKKHIKFIDSLGFRNQVILGGQDFTESDKTGGEFILLKVENIEKAKAIMQKDPVILTGTHTGEIKSFRMTAWFPGSWGRSSF